MPNPKRSRAGQVIIRSHQRLIDLAIDFLQEDDHNGVPDLVSDDDDQESINGTPIFGVEDDNIIEYAQHQIVRGPIEPTAPQLESWAVADNGASDAFNMYEANDIWAQHGQDQRVNTCRRMIWLRGVGIFLDYKIAYSKDSECCLVGFHLQTLCIAYQIFFRSN